MTGPRATASPPTLAHIAIALARSLGSVKTLVRIDRVAGMIERATDAHDGPGDDQRRCRPGVHGEHRATSEHDQSRAQCTATSEAVTERAG